MMVHPWAGTLRCMLQIDLWRNGSGWKHPMEHYTYRSREPFTEDRGKCMVDPDHLGGFNVRPFCPRMHGPMRSKGTRANVCGSRTT